MKRMLIQIYVKNQAEAFAFYKEAFHAEEGYCEKAPDGTVIHAELSVCGQDIAVGEFYDGSKEMIVGSTMQFCMQFELEEKEVITHAYERMKDGGRVLSPLGPCFFSPYMADLIDQYGVHWCLFI